MVSLDIDVVIASARDLVRAGRWEQATRLLDAAEPSGPHEAGARAAARADAEVDHAWWTRREPDPSLLDAARSLAADSAQAWAVEFAGLRASYARQLFAGRRDDADQLGGAAEQLAEQAPDAAARAYATFYRGLIAALLDDDAVAAERFWRTALDTDDEYVRSYALRHLGGLAADAGRHDEALELWRESTRLRQRVGFLPGVLAQLALAGDSDVVPGWATTMGIAATLSVASATESEVARESA